MSLDKVTYNSKDNIVVAEIKNDLNTMRIQKILAKLIRFGLVKKCQRFLIDRRDSAISESLPKLYKIIQKTKKTNIFNSTKKIACVYSKKTDKHKSIEKRTREIGLAGLRFFDDYKKAVEWLKEK